MVMWATLWPPQSQQQLRACVPRAEVGGPSARWVDGINLTALGPHTASQWEHTFSYCHISQLSRDPQKLSELTAVLLDVLDSTSCPDSHYLQTPPLPPDNRYQAMIYEMMQPLLINHMYLLQLPAK
jgi:hypothetical protein